MNKTKIGLFAFAMIFLSVSLVSAAGTGSYGNDYGKGKGFFAEDREGIKLAVEAGNYDAWKSLMESRITEENFNLLVERHSEMEDARELKEELREALENEDLDRAEEIKEELLEIMPERSECDGEGFDNEAKQKKGFFGKLKFWRR